MADNLSVQDATGTTKTLAADDISSVLYSRHKISIGADGEAADLDSGQATMANSLPVAIASDQSSVPVKGTGFSITATVTVTNGAYSVGDVIGGLMTFANAVSANGKSSYIDKITICGVVALPSEFSFFNADIATPAADNAAFALAAADGLKFLGGVPIAASDYMAAQNSFNNMTKFPPGGLLVTAAAGTRSIYAYRKATATTSPGTTTEYVTISGIYVD